MSCGVGHKCGSGPVLLCLWYRLAAAAPIQPLAWEFWYAAGMTLKKEKRKRKKVGLTLATRLSLRVFSGTLLGKCMGGAWLSRHVPGGPGLMNPFI